MICFDRDLEQLSVGGFIHHWRMSGTIIDIVLGKNITSNVNGVRGLDRYGMTSNSVIHFSPYGCLQVQPSAAYFDPATGGFTVMGWIKTELPQTYTMLDCG